MTASLGEWALQSATAGESLQAGAQAVLPADQSGLTRQQSILGQYELPHLGKVAQGGQAARDLQAVGALTQRACMPEALGRSMIKRTWL